MQSSPPSSPPAASMDPARQQVHEGWRNTLARVVPAVVVLKVTQCRAFDTESAGSSYATGFVVDKKLGLILTNRHVITPCPIVAEALFQNREEVKIYPLYYDPIHDFGFFRFDPSDLRHMELREIPLSPDSAHVGLDVRVVGNDSGEKISILSGTIARLDRDAPRYGTGSFNDFNTFYMQAASGTKGGSSGSPVIDIYGRAVGLNAGGKNKAASAYYLPLPRVVRALKIIQQECAPLEERQCWKSPRKAIPRGDLMVTFQFKGFDELKRLGLSQESENEARIAQENRIPLASKDTSESMSEDRIDGETVNKNVSNDLDLPEIQPKLQPSASFATMEVSSYSRDHTEEVMKEASIVSDEAIVNGAALDGRAVGMLVVDAVVPNGPGDGLLEPGDILIRINGEYILDFMSLETLLDDKILQSTEEIGKSRSETPVDIEVERGGKLCRVTVPLQNLSDVTPTSFIAVGGACIHSLSYQQARSYRSSFGQVYVADPGYLFNKAGLEKHAIITGINGSPTPDMDSFTETLLKLCHGQRVSIEWYTFDDRFRKRNALLHIDWCWYGPPKLWEQDDVAGIWHDRVLLPNGIKKLLVTPPSSPRIVRSVPFDDTGKDSAISKTETETKSWRNDLERQMSRALVHVDVEIPLIALADGVHSRSFSGCGIVVHCSENIGIVLVDRNTAVISPCDIMLSFGAYPDEIPARVRFMHPTHNFSLLSFNPKDLKPETRSLVHVASFVKDADLKRGDEIELVCMGYSLRLMHRTSTVTSPSFSVRIPIADAPRFRAVNEEIIKIDHSFGLSYSGALTNRECEILAMWGSFSEPGDKHDREWMAGLSVSFIKPWIDTLIKEIDNENGYSHPIPVKVLDAELEPLLLSKASHYGLPASWIGKLYELDPERRQVLRVRSTVAGSHAKEVLQDGDMILAVNFEPVSCFGDVERIIMRSCHGDESLNVISVRDVHDQGATATSGDGTTIRPSLSKLETDTNQNEQEHQLKRQSEDETSATDKTRDEVQEDASRKKARIAQRMPHEILSIANSRLDDNTINEKGNSEFLALTIFRNGLEKKVDVQLSVEDGLGTTHRLVHWSGALFQSPHRGVRELGFIPERCGVYISRWFHGSPAHRYGLYACHFLTHINDIPVPDLDSFVKTIAGLGNRADVRVRVIHFESARKKVITLKQDLIFWPTWELKLDPEQGAWVRYEITKKSPVSKQ